MKFGKCISSLFAFAVLAIAVMPATAGETKFATSTTNATVTFGADPYGQQEITAVLAKSDTSAGVVKFYAIGGAGKKAITTASTSGATVVWFDNTGTGIASNDVVVYAHANGTVLGTTVNNATTTNITLTAALTAAGSTNDVIYEVTQQGQIDIGTTALQLAGYTAFVVPVGSPCYVTANGTNSVTLTVTRK